MTRAVTQDDLFSLLGGYEDRMKRLEGAIFSGAAAPLPEPIGSIKTWTGKTIPPEFVIADGRTLTQAAYPDAYTFAVAEVANGNPLWTANTGLKTFTVPDLRDRFLYGQGANALGASGGEVNHTLTIPEIPSHSHVEISNWGGTTQGTVQGPAGTTTSGTYGGPMSTQATGGGGAHNNMPPFVVLAHLVKVRIQGPTAPIVTPVAASPTWQPVTFQTNWRQLNGTAPYSVEACKTAEGIVFLRGIAERINTAVSEGDNATDQIMYLPVGYRPPRTAYLSVIAYAPATTNMGFARLIVGPDGLCRVDHAISVGTNGGAISGAAGFYAVLDGVSFPSF